MRAAVTVDQLNVLSVLKWTHSWPNDETTSLAARISYTGAPPYEVMMKYMFQEKAIEHYNRKGKKHVHFR